MLQRFKRSFFAGMRGHHQFPGVAMWHAMTQTKLFRQAVALYAEARFKGIFWVVNPGMNDSTIARAGRHSQLWEAFHEENVLPPGGNRVRQAPSHHPPR